MRTCCAAEGDARRTAPPPALDGGRGSCIEADCSEVGGMELGSMEAATPRALQDARRPLASDGRSVASPSTLSATCTARPPKKADIIPKSVAVGAAV